MSADHSRSFPARSELRNPEHARTVIAEYVSRATEDSFDCFAMTRLVDDTLRALSKANQNSEYTKVLHEMLDGIESYIRLVGLITKTPVPISLKGKGERLNENRQNLLHLQRSLQSIFGNGVYLRMHRDLVTFLGQLSTQLKAVQPNDVATLDQVEFIFTSDALYHSPAVSVLIGQKDEQNQLLGELLEKGNPANSFSNARILNHVDALALSLVRAESIPVRSHEGHPYTSFTGPTVPTFAQALALQEDEIPKGLIKYAVAAPRGDVFWNNFLQLLFFTPLRVELSDELQDVKHPEILEKLMFVRQYLAEQLFLPSLTTVQVASTEVDQLLSQLLDRLDPYALEDLVRGLDESVRYSQTNWRVFKGAGVSGRDILMQVPIALYGREAFYREKMPDVRRLPFADEASYTIVSDHLDAICGDISSRIHSKNLDLFLKLLRARFKRNYIEGHSAKAAQEVSRFTGRLNEHLGFDATGYWNTLATQTELVNRSIGDMASRNVRRGYGIHPAVNDTCRFGEKTLPYLIGFEEIHFQQAHYSPNDVLFMLRMRDMSLAISGHVEVNGSGELQEERCALSATFPEALRGVEMVIKQVVLCSLTDLLTLSQSDQVKTELALRNSSPVPVPGEKKRPGRSKSERELPRERVFANSQSIVAEVHRVLEKTDTVRLPTPVDPYVRSLPGSVAYADLVAQYNSSHDESLIPLINKARSEMHHISPDKLNVPIPLLANQMRFIMDPITGERICLDTWVIDHFNPTPTSNERQSPTAMHERFYSHGPALEHLNFFLLYHAVSA